MNCYIILYGDSAVPGTHLLNVFCDENLVERYSAAIKEGKDLIYLTHEKKTIHVLKVALLQMILDARAQQEGTKGMEGKLVVPKFGPGPGGQN